LIYKLLTNFSFSKLTHYQFTFYILLSTFNFMKPSSSKKYIYFSALLGLILLLLFVVAPEYSWARPGGGHSYSGGGSSGGGGDDGIGILIWLLLDLLPPEISIPLVIIIVVVRMYMQRKKAKDAKSISSVPSVRQKASTISSVDSQIEDFKRIDPNFSKVLYLDFAAAMFNKYYGTWGKKEFANLKPFLSDEEIQASAVQRGEQNIHEIVIGSIHIADIRRFPDSVGITVDIDANFTVTTKGKSTRFAVIERWNFARNAGILSASPEKMRDVSCPHCGATSDFSDSGQCASCGTLIKTGEMQWYLKSHTVMSQEAFNTNGVLHYSPEMGTDLPTIYQQDFHVSANTFAVNHGLNFEEWRERFVRETVELYFRTIYQYWSENKLEKARHLFTDRAYESMKFWIDNYRRLNVRNKLDNLNIQGVELVKIEIDKYYEAATFRIYASVLDYVTDSNGKTIAGSSSRARNYSEYWTLVRRTGLEKDSFNIAACPKCGAPADKMGQGGVCEYCGSKISTGEFSWVLANITQDEVYAG